MLRIALASASVLTFLLTCSAARASDVRVRSAHAIVVDEASGEVLLTKNADATAPIASLTKLMTAMVVLDAKQDAAEELRIEESDADRLKFTRGGVPIGAVVSRGDLMELALLASDNRAASALARHYPGGLVAFNKAMQHKIQTLQLQHTWIEEPTGLSPSNVSSAQDMARVLRAAAGYGEISRITSQTRQTVTVNGEARRVNNTNRLVGEPGWDILASKTGYTKEAGRCLSLRLHAAGRTVLVVLMGAAGATQRALDATNIRRWLSGAAPLAAMPAATARAAPRTSTRTYRKGDGALMPRPQALVAAPAAAVAQEGGGEESAADVPSETQADESDDDAVEAVEAPDVPVVTGDEGE